MYISFGIGFDFFLPYYTCVGKNVIVFGADVNSSVLIDNKRKHILILDIVLTHRLDDTMLTAETQYSISFLGSNIKFCSSLHYNGSNSFLFNTATKNINQKRKILK